MKKLNFFRTGLNLSLLFILVLLFPMISGCDKHKDEE